jgi:DNA-directed RNA polymerase specialized sigma24 family protein
VSAPREETAFDREIDARYDAIQDDLMGFCERRGLRGMRAEQAVGDTFAVAFEHEAKGVHWDPEREPVEQYLGRILVNQFRKMRRNRLAGAAELNEGASVASDVTAVDVLLIEHEEHAILAEEVRTALIAETEAGLTLRILDALRAGIEGQSALSAHLKCPIPHIRSAYKRIKRRLLALREKKGGGR